MILGRITSVEPVSNYRDSDLVFADRAPVSDGIYAARKSADDSYIGVNYLSYEIFRYALTVTRRSSASYDSQRIGTFQRVQVSFCEYCDRSVAYIS